jgi:hypothetical protein
MEVLPNYFSIAENRPPTLQLPLQMGLCFHRNHCTLTMANFQPTGRQFLKSKIRTQFRG